MFYQRNTLTPLYTRALIKTFIFFDFECTQDDLLHCNLGYEPSTEDRKCKNCKQSWCGTKQHILNFCIAHKVCEKCMDQNVNKSSRCDVCGQNENVFVGDTARDDFCRWLFLNTIPVQKYCAVTSNLMTVILFYSTSTNMQFYQRLI